MFADVPAGTFPAFLTRRDEHGTHHQALWTQALIVCLLILIPLISILTGLAGSDRFISLLNDLSALSVVVPYAFIALSYIQVRRKGMDAPFKMVRSTSVAIGIGIATLVALVTVFDFLNPLLAAVWPEGVKPPKLHMGYASVIAAHTLFTMSLVIILVRARIAGMDRALIEASMDLYATPWRTFYQVTLPQIYPAILAGFLLSFTFSFDDFIISFFVAGANTTLPIYIFSSIRRGITPEVNAIGTMVLAVSLFLLMAAQFFLRSRGKR